MSAVINLAHRGAAGHRPENTMISFKYAWELGATGIETDIQMTKDGALVLIHDETLTRTAGTPEWVKDLTLAELRTREVGSWYHEQYRGEGIPQLADLLEWARDKSLCLNLELKNGIIPYTGMEQKVIDLIRDYQLEDRVILSSFNHYSLVACHTIDPSIRTAVLYMEGLYEPWTYASTIGASALHPFKYALTPELIQEAIRQGMPYHPFTVNDPQEMKKWIEAGISGIITDYPDRLAELLGSRGGLPV
ncbi:glycerophosphoryl diester phosphodiesterase [Paenibacillus shirakamiensis]|uniref:Glycerophosphoryl diester phosphodiesterase n=1 Tax=Paenibacillus shirakamiensis TaxID=1265935 RepID=A0ABS4JHU8_9BACL|nr:glycerophosphodiester phosphodiesterase [Paenibacillus shirakamiensis]MBP2000686.1 glycerophosphoryl diester phosphodiesterase [Paenibacillus shirakamiensis]